MVLEKNYGLIYNDIMHRPLSLWSRTNDRFRPYPQALWCVMAEQFEMVQYLFFMCCLYVYHDIHLYLSNVIPSLQNAMPSTTGTFLNYFFTLLNSYLQVNYNDDKCTMKTEWQGTATGPWLPTVCVTTPQQQQRWWWTTHLNIASTCPTTTQNSGSKSSGNWTWDVLHLEQPGR